MTDITMSNTNEVLTTPDTITKNAHEISKMVETLSSQYAFVIRKYQKYELCILVDSQKIRTAIGYGFIDAKALIITEYGADKIEIDCAVACQNWSKLKDLRGTINLMHHLDKLIPSKKSVFDEGIGLFTFQNGIQNSFEDLKKMGNLILTKLTAHNPLCIGFHNPTNGIVYGILNDCFRLRNEWCGNHKSLLIFRQLIFTLSKALPSHAYWVHIAHSEAGLIAHEAIATEYFPFDREWINFMKNKLIVLTYGAVAPVPDKVRQVINTYSRDDIVLILARKFLDKIPAPYPKHDYDLRKEAEDEIENPHLGYETVENFFLKLKAARDQEIENYKKDSKYISKYPHKSEKNGYTAMIIEREFEWDKRFNPEIDPPKPSKWKGEHAFESKTHQLALEKNINLVIDRNKILGNR